jgi:hypothetical protein
VEHLLRGGNQPDDELERQAAAYGVILPDELTQPADFMLWADHWPAVELFIRCMTQWRATSGGLIGLDYGVVLQMAKLYQVERLPQVMEDLQVMEIKARELLNKDAKR